MEEVPVTGEHLTEGTGDTMLQIALAGLTVGIDCRYDYLPRQCGAYVTAGTPDFVVRVDASDIVREHTAEGEATAGYLESLAAYRKIGRALLDYDAMILHAATISFDGRAYAFTAPSGTGKSTHIRLWKQVWGTRVGIVNGDKPVLRFLDGVLYAFGTPWSGKEGWERNVRVPLGAIVCLGRGAENRMARISASQAVPRLLHQILMPDDAAGAEATLALCDRILSCTPVYRLACNMDPSAAVLAAETLTGAGRPPLKE